MKQKRIDNKEDEEWEKKPVMLSEGMARRTSFQYLSTSSTDLPTSWVEIRRDYGVSSTRCMQKEKQTDSKKKKERENIWRPHKQQARTVGKKHVKLTRKVLGHLRDRSLSRSLAHSFHYSVLFAWAFGCAHSLAPFLRFAALIPR